MRTGAPVSRVLRTRALAALIAAAACTSFVFAAGAARTSGHSLAGALPPQAPSAPASGRAISLDVAVFDAAGNVVTDLAPGDFQVRIDGTPARVTSLRYVFRGPTADAAARNARIAPGTSTAVERSRVVLFAVDEQSIVQENEKLVLPVLWRAVDALGPEDQVAVISLPEPHGRALLSVDRKTIQEALARVSGRGEPVVTAAGGDRPRPGENAPDFSDEQELERPEAGAQQQSRATAEQSANDTPAATRPQGGANDPAPSSLQALTRLVSDMRPLAGQKHVVLVSAGTSSRRASRDALQSVIAAAVDARVVIHLLHAPRGGSGRTATELDRLAESTGGTVSKIAGSGADFVRLRAALAGTYVVEVEATPAPPASSPRTAEVTTTRPRVTLLAPARWSSREAPVTPRQTSTMPSAPPAPAATTAAPPDPARRAAPSPAPLAESPSAKTGATAAPDRSTAGPRRGTAADVALPPDLARLGAYVDRYLAEFSSLVIEEDYLQRATAPNTRTRSQRLKSDLLLVRTPGPTGWVPFRDVFEVNGQRLPDRQDRLRKLFLEQPDAAIAEGRRITEESARYNIGRIFRTINVPTLGLLFLDSTHLPGLHMERKREEVVDGAQVTRYDFLELSRPTIVKQDQTDRDLPSSGSVWVERDSGRVLKTVLRTGDEIFRMETTVTYRHHASLDLLVPTEMDETYRSLTAAGDIVYGTAKYSNFRRFSVSTQESTQLPR